MHYFQVPHTLQDLLTYTKTCLEASLVKIIGTIQMIL